MSSSARTFGTSPPPPPLDGEMLEEERELRDLLTRVMEVPLAPLRESLADLEDRLLKLEQQTDAAVRIQKLVGSSVGEVREHVTANLRDLSEQLDGLLEGVAVKLRDGLSAPDTELARNLRDARTALSAQLDAVETSVAGGLAESRQELRAALNADLEAALRQREDAVSALARQLAEKLCDRMNKFSAAELASEKASLRRFRWLLALILLQSALLLVPLIGAMMRAG